MAYRLTVHGSCIATQRRSRLVEVLKKCRIPTPFLYESSAQAARWLAYHKAWSPAQSPEVQQVYDRAFAHLLEPPPIWISLGAGGGIKEARALSRLGNLPERYLPVDSSPTLAIESMVHVGRNHEHLITEGLVIDLETPMRREDFLSDPTQPALWLVFGILPNAQDDFPEILRALVRTQDRILLSTNLCPRAYPEGVSEIVAQYDNAESRAWLSGALLELGLHPSGFELAVRADLLRPDGHAWRIAIVAKILETQQALIPEASIRWPPGTELAVFHSDRYTREGAKHRLEQAGFHSAAEHVAPAGDEGVFELHA